MGRQDLDRHDALQLGVARLEDHAHAAAADHLQHLVMIEAAERASLAGGAEHGQVGFPGTGGNRWRPGKRGSDDIGELRQTLLILFRPGPLTAAAQVVDFKCQQFAQQGPPVRLGHQGEEIFQARLGAGEPLFLETVAHRVEPGRQSRRQRW